ncbi:MAG: RNA polymerase sporulation sigma factor SigH [Anaerovoracaceae bacterium]
MDRYDRDLNRSEEELVRLAQNGNGEAEEILIRKYKEVVKTKAHLYFMVGADRDDIVQEGMIGIFKAIRSFDRSRHASFRTFADLCINRQILSAVKQAARKKHSPLNMSVSLNKPISDENRFITLSETLPTDSNSDPETLLLVKEALDQIGGNRGNVLSDFESTVWSQYLQGKTYKEIADNLGKQPKSIDNAIQRTKRKLALFLSVNT